MPTSPKTIEERINKMLTAWRTIAPKKLFAGMTYEQFEALVAPSLTSRQRINELEDKLTREKATRDQADATFNVSAQQIVAGVLADPTEGPDSALYEAMGYTPKRDRKSGLHRSKHKEPDTK